MGSASSKSEEEVEVIDPIRIVWDDLGNLKLVTQIEAEEKYNEKNRKEELEEIVKAEWEDQQEQEKLNVIKARENEDKVIKRKQKLEQLREEYREKVNNAVKKGEDYPPPFVEPPVEDDIEESLWYVMSSAWIEAWLEYVNVQRGLDPKLVRIVEAPCPGPCDNSVLLEWSLNEYDINDENKNELSYCWRAKKNLVLASNKDIGDYRRVSKRVWEAYKKLYPKSGPEIIMKYIRKGHYEHAKLIYTGSTDIKDWIIKDLPPPAGAKLKKSKKKSSNKTQKKIDISDTNDVEINIDKDYKNGSENNTTKSPMNIARLTSSGPDSDDDSTDDIILSSSKNNSNNKLQSSPPIDKIAFHTLGKDSDDDDDDDDVITQPSPPKSIISSLTSVTKGKTNITPIRLNKDSDDDDDDNNNNTKAASPAPIKSNSKLPPISLKKDSDDDSDESFELKKDNNKLVIGKLGETKVATIAKNKSPVDNNKSPADNNKSPAIFSLNKYTSNINEPDSDDDDTTTDEKDNKGFNNLKITPNQNKLAINLNNNNDEIQRRISESTSVPKASRISETSSDSMSIMSLLTSKKN